MKKIFKRQTIGIPLSLLMMILSSLAITIVVIYLQPGAFWISVSGMLNPRSLLLLNYLPILLLTIFFSCLCSNVFWGSGITALIAELLSYANLLKIEGRNDPLVPSDILLLRESFVAASRYHLNMHPMYILLIIGSITALLVLAVFVKTQKTDLKIRLAGAVLSMGILIGLIGTIYADQEYYTNLPDVSKSNVPLVYNTYGFPYCFLHNMNLYPVDRPSGYNAKTVREWETELLPSDTPLDVDIMMVMGEAFTDLSEEDAFCYAPEENPTYDYRQLADSDRAVSGHMVVSNFGAGTANTEFDVLTGMQTGMIGETTTSAFRVIRRNTESLARIYGQEGYSCWFMHPGQSWFYNRCNVFSYLGIDDQIFQDAFSEKDTNGDYVADTALLGYMCRKLESISGNSFSYITTIENHQSYRAEKYRDPVVEIPATSLELSDDVREQLAVYFTGIRHTAELISNLSDYLDTVERPTLLVFFGDHRPAMGGEYQCYRAIGSNVGRNDTMEHSLYTNETPYMIWANEAFCQKYDFKKLTEKLELPEGNRISSSYLGSLVYELSGRRGSDAYWDYLTQARRILPVISNKIYMLPDGTVTDTLTEEQAFVEKKLHWWQYYQIKNGISEK